MSDAGQLTVDATAIETFAVALFAHASPGAFVSLRSFRENGGSWASVSPVAIGNDLSALVEAAKGEAMQAAGYSEPTVFCPPVCTFSSRSKATEKDIAEGVALSVECDQHPAAARQRLEKLLGPATVVVESGGIWTNPETGAIEPKLHLHWRLNRPATGADLKLLKEARKLATKLVGGDVSNVPISHPLRWPGSLHRKSAPKLCRIAARNMSTEIDLGEALEALRAAATDFTAPTSGNGADRHPDSGDRADVGELTRNILEGKDLHRSTLLLAASFVTRGMAPAATVQALRDIMRTTPEDARDARWQSRFDDLPRLVAGAHERFGDPFAPPLGEGWDTEEEPASTSSTSSSSASPDDEPLPLFESPAAAAPFPVEALPDCIANPINAIARKAQVPHAMAAQSVLSVLALALQGHADIKLPYADAAPISEFFLTLSDSGDRKTTSDALAMKGLVRDRVARSLDYDFQYADWRIRHGAWAAQEASIKKRSKLTLQERTEALRELGPAPKPLLKPERIVTNLTTEGLLKMFGEALPSLGAFNNEGAVVTSGFSMREENIAATGATLSSLWDGSRMSKVRVGEGHTTVDGCRFSSHLMIQPSIATAWINDPVLTGQGLFSRELIAWPESLKGTRTWREPVREDTAEIDAFGDRVFTILQRELPVDPTTRKLTPREVAIQQAAMPDWVAFYNRIEAACAPGQPLNGIHGFGEKAGQHALRLATIIMLADDFEALTLGPEPMRAGIALAEWYVDEIVRIRAGTRVFDRDEVLLPAAQKLINFLKGHPSGLPTREVLRRGPQELRTKSKLGKAVKLLDEHRWLEPGLQHLKLRESALNG